MIEDKHLSDAQGIISFSKRVRQRSSIFDSQVKSSEISVCSVIYGSKLLTTQHYLPYVSFYFDYEISHAMSKM